jgi:hypothetical protein
VLVVKVGYVGYGTDAARVLFHVVNDATQAQVMIFTTSKLLERWSAVLHDEDLSDAIKLDGPSLRTRPHLTMGSTTSQRRAVRRLRYAAPALSSVRRIAGSTPGQPQRQHAGLETPRVQHARTLLNQLESYLATGDTFPGGLVKTFAPA